MRFKYLFLILIFLVSACTFQVEVFGTPTPQSTEAVIVSDLTATPIITNNVLPTLTPSPPFAWSATPLPSFTAGPVLPSPVPATLPADGSLPILFSANGTAASIPGTVEAGSSKTYSLTAFGGQVMSVSVGPEQNHPERTFQLEIKGQDGVVLCPIKDNSCAFWRGTLPSTQKYFIRVTPQSSGFFDLVVAINPPGQANQYFNYSDPLGRFQLSYSDEFALAYYAAGQVTKFPPQLVLQYIDTQQYTGTNLGEAYFMIDASDDPQQVSTCTQLASLGGPETSIGDVNINGITYTQSQAQGVGAGNIYEQDYHRTVQNGVCYEITYFIHYSNIGNYTPGTVEEFDRAALLQRFDEVLNTITFK